VTPRPTDSTGESENLSDEAEELCRSYTEHPVKILEMYERVTWDKKIKTSKMQWIGHAEKMSRGRLIRISLLASPESRDEIPVRG